MIPSRLSALKVAMASFCFTLGLFLVVVVVVFDDNAA